MGRIREEKECAGDVSWIVRNNGGDGAVRIRKKSRSAEQTRGWSGTGDGREVVVLRWQTGQRRGRIQYANRRTRHSLTSETERGAVNGRLSGRGR